jgi:hypothetical protein
VASIEMGAPPASAAPGPSASTPPVRPAVSHRPTNELNALSFGWAVFKAWFGGLFGKRT